MEERKKRKDKLQLHSFFRGGYEKITGARAEKHGSRVVRAGLVLCVLIKTDEPPGGD